MPRRSRRSPRHLRVSGQRRRRYRDERYPTQSPMPLTVACASPEMASGKVWIRYPVVRPQDQQPEEVQVQDASVAKTVEAVAAPVAVVETVTAAPVTVEPATMEPVTAEPVVVEPVAAAEPLVVDAAEVVAPAAVEPAPQEPVTEAPAVEAPQAIAPVTLDAEPVVVEPEAVETTPVVAAPVETIAPVAETVEQAPVTEAALPNRPSPGEQAGRSGGSSPCHRATTRAPAPDYVPEAPRHSTGCARRSPLKVKAPPVVIARPIKPPLNRLAHSPSSSVLNKNRPSAGFYALCGRCIPARSGMISRIRSRNLRRRVG